MAILICWGTPGWARCWPRRRLRDARRGTVASRLHSFSSVIFTGIRIFTGKKLASKPVPLSRPRPLVIVGSCQMGEVRKWLLTQPVASLGACWYLVPWVKGKQQIPLLRHVSIGEIAKATLYFCSFAEGNTCNKAIEQSLQENVDCKSRLNFVLHFCTKELISETISQLATHL